MTDPTIGFWLSEDGEFVKPDPSNLYRYVGNDPTNLTDATGLSPNCCSSYISGGQVSRIPHAYLQDDEKVIKAFLKRRIEISETLRNLTLAQRKQLKELADAAKKKRDDPLPLKELYFTKGRLEILEKDAPEFVKLILRKDLISKKGVDDILSFSDKMSKLDADLRAQLKKDAGILREARNKKQPVDEVFYRIQQNFGKLRELSRLADYTQEIAEGITKLAKKR